MNNREMIAKTLAEYDQRLSDIRELLKERHSDKSPDEMAQVFARDFELSKFMEQRLQRDTFLYEVLTHGTVARLTVLLEILLKTETEFNNGF